MDQRIIDLYDEHTHAPLARRSFLRRLATLTGSMGTAVAILPLLQASKAAAARVAADDARLRSETVSFKGATGELRGYLVRPGNAPGPLPGVVVIHENRGLNPHIEDVTRRVALEGYVALAPDFLSPSGGTPADEDTARELIGKLDPEQTLRNATATVRWLRERDDTTQRIGAVGFCWGGSLVGSLAEEDPSLSAAVVFYGRTPDPAKVGNIKAKLLLHYAGLDERINADVPAFRSALDQAGVQYTVHLYEGVNHAFHNDTSAARYDAAAARIAWERSMEFFGRTLSGQ